MKNQKIEQNEPLEFVMLFNKRTKKEHIPTYKTLKHEININDSEFDSQIKNTAIVFLLRKLLFSSYEISFSTM